ncbi:MAG: hypothetical protein SWC96_11080 [Thermodesulfobacteriota bacterium]|nr:hypothetical protein [Thermodesulfobacteriota bacterium]
MTDVPDTEKQATDIDSVLNYFLLLFKRQVGVGTEAASEVEPLQTVSGRSRMVIYDLHVDHDNMRSSRRMTLGPIGDGSGSKSKCYLAIYDSKLVVKVPPVPITDFNKYLASIKKGQEIARTVSPRECIVPGISVILSKIHPFPDEGRISAELLENAYIALLEETPELADFLKIDGGFVFFMDLAKYVFLADAIALFHDAEEKLPAEILRDPSILEDIEKFEGRYGMENIHVGVALERVYADYENRVRKLMIRSGAASSLLLYKLQQWFFSYLSGNPVKPQGRDLTESFASQLNALLKDVVEAHRKTVEDYITMVSSFLSATTFSRRKLQMEGVVANILELLSWLKRKNVAIRDIKPDNLLVAGDPEKYPNFLSSPETYRIGLIDVETAVDFAPGADETIAQPPLGGTPFYATPLHLFKNGALLSAYRDMKRAFYLQDWFAVIAMIYGAVVGSYLFPRTALQVVSLTKKIQKAVKAKQPIEQVMAGVNRLFWPGAVAEFEENMAKNRDRLAALRVVCCDPVRTMFIEELAIENGEADRRIKQLIGNQSFFKNKQNREQLYLFSPEKLADILEKIADKKESDLRSFAALEQIGRLKQTMQRNARTIALFRAETPNLSVYALLEIMFSIVRNFMDSPSAGPAGD